MKEKVGLARVCALMAGFIGVLLVAAPGADSFRVGAMFALANAILFGSVTAAVRGMTTTESAETLTMYQMNFLTLFFALPLPFFFAWPTSGDAGTMLGNGVINAVGQYWWTRALSLAPPSAVGPFYYFMLVWSAALGFVFWGDVPTLALIVGSAVVVGSGLFLLWHETSKKSLAAD
ncbi:MAG: DMT family transporter [Pseudolabrys sp.]